MVFARAIFSWLNWRATNISSTFEHDHSIFISYRRATSAGHAGRLFDRLRSVFQPAKIFIDVDGISPGENFEMSLGRALSQCGVALVLIGRDWAPAFERLSNADNAVPDYVRVELEEILNSDILAIPILLDGAEMPMPSDVPLSIRALLRRNALPLNHATFDDDSHRIIRATQAALVDADKNVPDHITVPQSPFGPAAQHRDIEKLPPSRIPIIYGMSPKGGTGRTFIAANVSAAIKVALGKRVLIVDFDGQGSMTQLLLRRSTRIEWTPSSIYLVKRDATAKDFLSQIIKLELTDEINNNALVELCLSGGGYELMKCEGEETINLFTSPVVDPRFKAARILRDANIQALYDCIIIDGKPAFSLLTQSAFLACTHYYIPARLDAVGVPSVPYSMEQVNELQSHLGVAPKFLGVLSNMTEKAQVALQVPMLGTSLPNFRSSDAQDDVLYFKYQPARAAFDRLAKEIWNKCGEP